MILKSVISEPKPTNLTPPTNWRTPWNCTMRHFKSRPIRPIMGRTTWPWATGRSLIWRPEMSKLLWRMRKWPSKWGRIGPKVTYARLWPFGFKETTTKLLRYFFFFVEKFRQIDFIVFFIRLFIIAWPLTEVRLDPSNWRLPKNCSSCSRRLQPMSQQHGEKVIPMMVSRIPIQKLHHPNLTSNRHRRRQMTRLTKLEIINRQIYQNVCKNWEIT